MLYTRYQFKALVLVVSDKNILPFFPYIRLCLNLSFTYAPKSFMQLIKRVLLKLSLYLTHLLLAIGFDLKLSFRIQNSVVRGLSNKF